MTMDSCAQCLHSRPAISDDPDEGPLLKCHRYPPVMFVYADEVAQSWPDASETCGEFAVPLPVDVTPPTYDHDQDETPNQGRGVDLDRTEGDDAPGLTADAGTQSGPHEGVEGPVGQDHGGAASEPEPTPEGDGASDPPHAAPSFLVGAHHDVHEDRSRSIGVEDHREFPVGEWTRLYVPTARLVDCCEALNALFESEAGTLEGGD